MGGLVRGEGGGAAKLEVPVSVAWQRVSIPVLVNMGGTRLRASGLESPPNSCVAGLPTGITPSNSGSTTWPECIGGVLLSDTSGNLSTLIGVRYFYSPNINHPLPGQWGWPCHHSLV